MSLIYKICHAAEWEAAERQGLFAGSAKDREDHFIHFSSAVQVPGTLARFYAGCGDLVLVAVDADKLGAMLIYERAGSGGLFPHLYGTLPLAAVLWVKPVALRADGTFLLPEECV